MRDTPSPDAARPAPRATYRLQFHAGFGFAAATAILPDLAALGVSHVYASPFLKARPGSTHGYDIVDHGELNPELGSRADFDRFVAALQAEKLGLILDFVPNHMGVGGADNPFWLDMLEWGQASDYAGWFDVDWRAEAEQPAPSDRTPRRVLIPVLGDHYGVALRDGDLHLGFDAAAGAFAVWAYETHKLPIRPVDYGAILGADDAMLEQLGDAFSHLEAHRPHEQRRVAELKRRLADAAREPAIAAAVAARLALFQGTPGELTSWRRLDALIATQHWRVAHFRVAADDINYRRFFNINDLAAVRIEHEELFNHAHQLVFDLIAAGVLDGLRIDHIDGLLDPKTYCRRLRDRAPRPIYLVVEKILAPDEPLRADWGVDGTTGYEFANQLTGLFIDPAGAPALSAAYRAFTGRAEAFDDIARISKYAIMDNEMAGELNTLARDAARIARSNPLTADFTQNVLRRALREIVAGFAFYRSYVDADGASAEDRAELAAAIARARAANGAIDPSVFDFLERILSTEATRVPGSGFSRQEVLRFAMQFQQYTGPVMAKGVEDTAFYRYNRFVAANEVGGAPETLGTSIAAFHAANRARLEATPNAMLATTTHDTKRGEDTRARLAALSEQPEAFAAAVARWSEMLAEARDPILDRNDDYLFYQLLLGAWPPGLGDDDAGLAVFRDRIAAAMLKSVREAKVHTTWARPNAAYEAALDRFIAAAFATPTFVADIVAFQTGIAALGGSNSLAQVVLKLTVPGVPDLYQGAEAWDFSLVDPDNRRPVDDALRRARLLRPPAALDAASIADGTAKPEVVRRLLNLRREHPDLFSAGSYEPIDLADTLVAFRRRAAGKTLTVLVRRFPSRDLPEAVSLTLVSPVTDILGDGMTLPAGTPDLRQRLTAFPALVLIGDG